MSSESSFKVALRDLPAHRRVVVPAAYVADLLRGMPLRDALDAVPSDDGGHAELDLDSDGKSVFVQGSIVGQVTVACSRCVTAVPISFDEPVRVTYMPAAQVAAEDDPDGASKLARAGKAADGEGKARSPRADRKDSKDKDADEDDGVELAEGDLDVFPYSGDVVDLEPLIREQFVLSVPFAPLCKEDCLGLCDQCGADKNHDPCACARPVDPRFAALQGLKLAP